MNNNNNYADLQLERMLAQNHQTSKEKREKAIQSSLNKQKIEYRKQKKAKNKTRIKAAIMAIVITATMTIGASHVVKQFQPQQDKEIESNIKTNDVIENKVNDYMTLMNMYSDSENTIEIQTGRNFQTPNYEPTVYYKEDNLAKHIINAAKISETETRCTILAAYKIINAPYRDEVIGKALYIASQNQEENLNYAIPGTTKELLDNLGHENWQDYHQNERNSIIDLYELQANLQTTNGKGK